MHTFLTPEPITVEIRNASGEIRIDLADVTTTTVDVIASASHPLGFLDDVIRAAKTQFAGDRRAFAGNSKGRYDESFDGGNLADDPVERVRVDLRESAAGGSGASTLIVDTDPARDGWKSSFVVHVTAPSASGVRIQSQSADVVVTGRADRLETRTASGDVNVGEVDGRSVVQTASGDVRITATGECDVRTASGDIETGKVTDEAIVHSTSGDIRLDAALGKVSARSVSGDVRVLDATAGQLEIITVSGDVEVGIHAGTLTAVDLSTVSGTTNSDFEVSSDAPAGDDDTEESPTLDLRVKTTSGNIRLRRSIAV
ncbi:MAG: DUF4097 family beta strand repeat-containing protein [Nakamurella sp.]